MVLPTRSPSFSISGSHKGCPSSSIPTKEVVGVVWRLDMDCGGVTRPRTLCALGDCANTTHIQLVHTHTMSADSSHRILHRMVPLICQALTTSSNDETVWLEGLRLLTNPKLRTAMGMTSSIWLPLLLKGLESSKPQDIILTALKLLAGLTETLEPMKSCLVKPLRALGKKADIADTEELSTAVERLGLVVLNNDKEEIGRPRGVSLFISTPRFDSPRIVRCWLHREHTLATRYTGHACPHQPSRSASRCCNPGA